MLTRRNGNGLGASTIGYGVGGNFIDQSAPVYDSGSPVNDGSMEAENVGKAQAAFYAQQAAEHAKFTAVSREMDAKSVAMLQAVADGTRARGKQMLCSLRHDGSTGPLTTSAFNWHCEGVVYPYSTSAASIIDDLTRRYITPVAPFASVTPVTPVTRGTVATASQQLLAADYASYDAANGYGERIARVPVSAQPSASASASADDGGGFLSSTVNVFGSEVPMVVLLGGLGVVAVLMLGGKK